MYGTSVRGCRYISLFGTFVIILFILLAALDAHATADSSVNR